MARYAQKNSTKGSQYWLQSLVDGNDSRLCDPIAEFAGVPNESVSWLSPRQADEWAEYRDHAFLDLLNLKADKFPLEEFWPSKGPQWDALGLADGMPILVEARAHLNEMLSPACGASLESRATITRSLFRVQSELKIASQIDWLGVGYQYTNRLAHLFFLRELNGIPAHLVFVYICDDPTLTAPVSKPEWEGAVRLFESMLGTRRHRLSPFVHHLFVEVGSK